jgi:hypothetical protein
VRWWHVQEEVIMAKSPDEIVAEIERRQNKEDLELPSRAAKAVSKIANKPAPEGSTPSPENPAPGMKKGGKVKSASSRADGCCIRGKTKA